MKTRHCTFLLTGALATALVTVFLGRHQRVSRPTPPETEPAVVIPMETASSPQGPPTPTGRFRTYQWRPGDYGCWQFGVSFRLASTPETVAESEETRLGGKLQLVVLSADSQRVTLAAALSDAWFHKTDQRVGSIERFLNSTPAIVTLSPSGHVREMAFPRQVADEDRKILRLVYGWEFVARDAPSYQEEEHAPDDADSLVRAAYRRLDNARIQKKRFLQPATIQHPDAHQNLVASEFTASVGNFWIREMSGWEDAVMYLNGSIFAASRVAVTIKEETNAPALTPVLTTLLSNPGAVSAFTTTADPATSAQGISVSEAVRREALDARWGSVPFDQVLSPLQTGADGPMQDSAKPLQDLEDWLVAHPDEGPAKVLQHLQGLQADQTGLSCLLTLSLAEADTGSARKALATILDAPESFPPSTVIQAAVAVGGLGSKTEPALRETLVRLMDSPFSDGSYRLSDTALFAFARLAKDDAASQQYLAQRVAPWLEANADPENTVKALSALANAAADDPQLVERAAACAKSADPDIRLAVVDYLGSLPNTSPGRALLDPLLTDPDPRVQEEAKRLRVR